LAGPVGAAAVALPAACGIDGLNDSKALSEKRRDLLFDQLQEHPHVVIGVSIISPADIDRFNILRATHMAMRKAASALDPSPDLVFIDGLAVPEFPFHSRNVVKGDAKCACIAAASIIAKVTRDRLMIKLAKAHPEYGFDRHKGYGTAEHLAALARHGACPSHRRSFRPVAEVIDPPPVQGELGF
jgi:ribonuclease HII